MYAEKNYRALGYNPGAIVRVKVKNFLTYDECEVFPGPKLNVVIGPNGSGKSTLTHAICLACCGSTGDIGRASDLAKFVKRGKLEEESFVEVDILEESGTLVTLRRTINATSNSSKWLLNSHPCTLSEAKKLIARFNIDVDNLCSFMPQDKVGKFTQYTPKEVLQNTLKSIRYGNKYHITRNSSSSAAPEPYDDDGEEKDLFTEQQELSNSQELKENLRKTKESKQAHVEHLQRQMQTLSLELDRLKQKDRAKEMKKHCEIKLRKIYGIELKGAKEELTASIQELSNSIKTASEQLAPQKVQCREYEKLFQKISKDENAILDEFQNSSDKINADVRDMGEYEENADKNSIEVVNVEAIRLATEREYEAKSEEYRKTEAKLNQSLRDVSLIQEEIHRLEQGRRDVLQQKDSCQGTVEELSEQIEQNLNSLRDVTRQISSLQDTRAIFKQKFVQRAESGDRLFRDTLVAMDWLEKNQDILLQQNRLRGGVTGPLALEIKTRDPACSAMLEQVIPLNRLLGFLVTNDQDATFLKNKFRKEMNLQIDIFTMKNVQSEPPRLPYSDEMLRRMQIPGLQGYLYRQIECNDVVKSFLFSFQNVHTILWGRSGSAEIGTEQLLALCPEGIPGFRLFMHEDRGSTSRGTPQRKSNGSGSIIEYNGRKSRYAPNAPPSTASFVVSPKGIISSVGSGYDDTAVEELREELHERKRKGEHLAEELSAEFARQQNLLSQYQTEALGLKSQIQDLSKKLKLPAQLEQMIANQKKILKDLEKRLTVDSKNQKILKQKQYADTVDNLLTHLEDMTSNIQSFSQRRTDRRVLQTMKQIVQAQLEDIQSALKKQERDIDDMKRSKEQYRRQLESVEKELGLVTAEMNQIIDTAGGYEKFINEIFPKVLEDCPQNTRQDIEDRIVEIEAQIKAIIDNPQVVERYQTLESELDQCSKELETADKDLQHAETSLQQRSEHWLDVVKSITQKLNNLFSAYMKGLGFDGQIDLRPIGRFIDYEMQLRVSFREGALCDLSGSRHSGGERAVSTIMFLMALQQMTSSPFRVVDEINQGMDERNERLVFDRIVKSCCEDSNAPQYFLVTPKLLQGLRCLDHPEVTVLLIWNGPGIQEKWNLSTIIRNLKRKRGSSMTDEVLNDDEETKPAMIPQKNEKKFVKEELIQPKLKYMKVK